MKKRILSLLLLLSVLCMVACQGAETSTTKKPSDTTTSSPPENNPFKAYDTPLSELTTYTVGDRPNFHLSMRNMYGYTGYWQYNLEYYNTRYPIERIERVDNDHICVIYRLEKDDVSAYVYMIFENDGYTSDENIYQGWTFKTEYYYVSTPLSSSDFASISIGDCATKVSAIDPSLPFDMKNFVLDNSNSFHAFAAYKLLTDGLLIITLEAPLIDGKTASSALEDYSVRAMTFYPHNSTEIPNNVSVLGYPDLLQDN
ncbi:MAG: hypothetical protein IJW29_07610 [Clostridia bacterium]|nr:hypothetical protein [Clostridia bacterium]